MCMFDMLFIFIKHAAGKHVFLFADSSAFYADSGWKIRKKAENCYFLAIRG